MGEIVRDWSGNPIGIIPGKGENPMLVVGFGPEGKTCGTCSHFLRLPYHNQTYRKCDQRKITHGAGSDHKASWPACKRYEEVVNP